MNKSIYTENDSKFGFWQRRLRNKFFVLTHALPQAMVARSEPKNLRGLLSKFQNFESLSVCLLAGALLLELPLEGWGGSYRAAINQEFEEQQSALQNFPYSPTQSWFIEENYLLWKPFLGDLEYGLKTTSNNQGGNLLNSKVKVKTPEFDWSSGVRMGIGKYLPHHDGWDVSAYMTYLYVDSKNETHADPSQGQSFNPTYTQLFNEIVGQKARSTWRVNYFVWDLMLGREFQILSRMVFHPYIGLRGAVIDQDFKTSVEGSSSNTSRSVSQSLTYSQDDDFWALGLRLGTDFQFLLSRHWVLLGNFAAAFMYGHDDIKGEVNSVRNSTPFLKPAYNARETKNKDDPLHTNLEGYIGLGWETWFRNNSVRLAPAILFEGSVWSNMNQIFDPDVNFSQTNGSLGFMGLTFNLQVDF